MQGRKAALFVAAGIILVTTGCVSTREHQKKVNALQNQLENERHNLDALSRELEEERSRHQQTQQQLEDAGADVEEFSELSARLRQAKEERERNLREMEDLVRDISGMRIEPRAEGDFIVIENEILFDPGQIELKEEAKETIKNTVVPYIRDQLERADGQMIRIDGHTDGQPIRLSPWEDNYHLSLMRAHSVLNFLAGENIPVENMFLAGFGPNRPVIEPQEPEEDVPENRRVEILLIPDRDDDDVRHLLQELVR